MTEKFSLNEQPIRMCVSEYSSTFSTPALGDDERSVLFPTAVFRGKNTRHPLNRKLGGPKDQSERFGEEINLLLLPGIEPRFLGRPLHNLVITLTCYPDSLVTWRGDKNAIFILGFCDSHHTILPRNSLLKRIFGPRDK
jgi:hypothetical protein